MSVVVKLGIVFTIHLTGNELDDKFYNVTIKNAFGVKKKARWCEPILRWTTSRS